MRWSERYDQTVIFYRDIIGLPVLETFHDSYGLDGTILGLPGGQVHQVCQLARFEEIRQRVKRRAKERRPCAMVGRADHAPQLVIAGRRCPAGQARPSPRPCHRMSRERATCRPDVYW